MNLFRLVLSTSSTAVRLASLDVWEPFDSPVKSVSLSSLPEVTKFDCSRVTAIGNREQYVGSLFSSGVDWKA